MTATVNVVVLAGTVASDPVTRTMPSGDRVTELRVSVPQEGKRLLPLPVAVWPDAEVVGVFGGSDGNGGTIDAGPGIIGKGSEVLIHGALVRRFYRSGAGARSLTEVVASGIKLLDPATDTE